MIKTIFNRYSRHLILKSPVGLINTSLSGNNISSGSKPRLRNTSLGATDIGSAVNLLNEFHLSNLENIKYLTKGEFSKIYTPDWIGGWYEELDSEEQLVRFGTHDVIFKNVENASQRWFEEV
ncbi:7995_t:CDS:2 [Rhizophagus irregularis]|nr:7995_t:CDS:2 [Rhizophagus irregularis]